MCNLIDSSKAINPSNHRRDAIKDDPDLFDLLNNKNFKSWLCDADSATLRIVDSPRWNLRALYSSLSQIQADDCVFHFDLETLSRE